MPCRPGQLLKEDCTGRFAPTWYTASSGTREPGAKKTVALQPRHRSSPTRPNRERMAELKSILTSKLQEPAQSLDRCVDGAAKRSPQEHGLLRDDGKRICKTRSKSSLSSGPEAKGSGEKTLLGILISSLLPSLLDPFFPKLEWIKYE